mmetsp:Transcript_142926/g.249359  ORF Transcript_142926/g.249359 Transcript_142926/m.249359 type:complete len:207 (+) Transcript_142926:1492-2112(+)
MLIQQHHQFVDLLQLPLLDTVLLVILAIRQLVEGVATDQFKTVYHLPQAVEERCDIIKGGTVSMIVGATVKQLLVIKIKQFTVRLRHLLQRGIGIYLVYMHQSHCAKQLPKPLVTQATLPNIPHFGRFIPFSLSPPWYFFKPFKQKWLEPVNNGQLHATAIERVKDFASLLLLTTLHDNKEALIQQVQAEGGQFAPMLNIFKDLVQ